MYNRIMLIISLALVFTPGWFSGANAEALIEEETIGLSERLSDHELDEQRGGDDAGFTIGNLEINTANVGGNVAGNQANGVFTGTSVIEGSFISSPGLNTVIVNSGPNSLIQAVTTINIDFVQ